jgi:hypothetical protein
MSGDRFIAARRLRHILNAWLLWPVCITVAAIPILGPPFAGLLALLGLLCAVQVVAYGHRFQGLFLFCMQGILLLCLPMIWGESLNGAVRDARTLLPWRKEEPASNPPPRQPAWIAPSVARPAPRKSEWKNPLANVPTKRGTDTDIPKWKVETFVRGLFSASVSGDLEAVRKSYAGHVQFHGTPLSRDEITEIYEARWREWPIRQDLICSPVLMEEQEPGVLLVVFTEQIDRFRPNDGRSFKTKQEHILKLKAEDGGLKVVEEFYRPIASGGLRGGASKPREVEVNTPEDEIRLSVLKAREAETKREIAGAMRCYADKVSYFGQSRRAHEIRADKLEYFKKWPAQEESIVGKVEVKILNRGYASMQFRSRFRVSNPSTGEWRTGLVDNRYTLLIDQYGWKVVGQDGEVHNLQKGTNSTGEE